MKFLFCTLCMLFSLFGGITFGQSQVIDKVFSDMPVEKRSQLEIIDTIQYDYLFWDNYDYYSYETSFGMDDFEFFLIYRHKDLNKVGLIVYGEDNFYATDAVADSIYFISATDLEYNEFYDDFGNYYSMYNAKSLYFGFENKGKQAELWTLTTGEKYSMKKSGNIHRDLFKAVSFTEVISEEEGNYVTGVFANLNNNKIYNSAVLNEGLVRAEVYAYRYDSYYYGEYDYYYDYSSPDIDFTMPYFETRLNNEPVEIIYLMSGDTISEVISYEYNSADEWYYITKNVPSDFEGVWKIQGSEEAESTVIIDADEIYYGYNLIYGSIDAFKGAYEVGVFEFEDALKKMRASDATRQEISAKWKGSKSALKFISFTSFNSTARFKDYYLYNGDQMLHIYLTYNENGNVDDKVEVLEPQKVYEETGLSFYDSYNYATYIKDKNGKTIDLLNSGVDYYYNYNISVADRNIDDNGNLVLTDETLGSVNFKAFSYGDSYLGQVRIQWIGNPVLENGGSVVSIKNMPFKIVDQSDRIICDDVFSLYVSNVQGFNLYQVTNSQNQIGVLGPDGNWIVKQEWDAISILGPYSSFYYETIGLPAFFVVYKGTSCGALDSKGNWVVPMGQEYIEICKNEILVTNKYKLSVYSFDGKLLIDNLDGVAGDYYNEYATDCYSYDFTSSGHRVLIKDDKYGIVDEKFNIIIPFEYTYMNPIPNTNQFIAANADGKYGILETGSKIVLPFEYDNITPFDYYPNRLVASKDGKQGVIDNNGNLLIPFEFYSISTYSDWASNLIYISDPDYRTNIIDTTGKSIINAACSYVYLYPSYSVVFCEDNGKVDFYNLEGELLYSKILEYLDPYSCYDYIQIYQTGTYDDPKFGAFDITTGDEIMPAEFESLYPFWINDQLFYAGYKKGKVGIYSATGEELIKPKGYYLDNYYYEDGYYGGEVGYFVEISDKKGKSKVIKLNW